MNYRRGFVRLWALISAIYVVWFVWRFIPIAAEIEWVRRGNSIEWGPLSRLLALTFAPPLILLGAGALIGWAVAGFRRL